MINAIIKLTAALGGASILAAAPGCKWMENDHGLERRARETAAEIKIALGRRDCEEAKNLLEDLRDTVARLRIVLDAACDNAEENRPASADDCYSRVDPELRDSRDLLMEAQDGFRQTCGDDSDDAE